VHARRWSSNCNKTGFEGPTSSPLFLERPTRSNINNTLSPSQQSSHPFTTSLSKLLIKDVDPGPGQATIHPAMPPIRRDINQRQRASLRCSNRRPCNRSCYIRSIRTTSWFERRRKEWCRFCARIQASKHNSNIQENPLDTHRKNKTTLTKPSTNNTPPACSKHLRRSGLENPHRRPRKDPARSRERRCS
jgi:hypothetical protein